MDGKKRRRGWRQWRRRRTHSVSSRETSKSYTQEAALFFFFIILIRRRSLRVAPLLTTFACVHNLVKLPYCFISFFLLSPFLLYCTSHTRVSRKVVFPGTSLPGICRHSLIFFYLRDFFLSTDNYHSAQLKRGA